MTWEGSEPEAAGGGDRFPWLVAIASLAIGVWIFLRSTVVAVQERDELQRAEDAMEARAKAYLDASVGLRNAREELPRSGDRIMVELDRHDLHPDDPEVREMAESERSGR